MGQTLKEGRCLDIEAELELANDVKAKLVMERSGISHGQLEKVAMKELGLKRYAPPPQHVPSEGPLNYVNCNMHIHVEWSIY